MAYTNNNGQSRVGVRIVPFSVVIPTISTLLDSYSGAAAAYSLRKLKSSYGGSAIRVRRSSDNTEQNIGFDSVGNLDTYALSSFVGTGNGFVTTWYDQSGNNRDATQTTAGNQPQIVSNGVVNTFNSKPCVKFDGSNDFIQSPYTTGTSNELYFVTQTTDTSFLFPRGITGYGFVADQGNTSTNTSNYWLTQPQLYVNSVLSSPANRGAVYNLLNGYKLSVHKGVDISNNFNYLRFGSFIQDGNFDFNGNLFEWIIYPTLQSSQSSIESNINSYYSVYPNPTSVWNLLNAVYSADTTASSSLKTSLFASYNGESNTNDSFGANNGTAVGGLTYTTGKIGNAFDFNGTNAYISLPNSSNQFNFTGDFSVSAWINTPNYTSSRMIFANYVPGGTYGYGILFYHANNNIFSFELRNGNTIGQYQTSAGITTNSWNHIVVVRKVGQNTKIYLNGVLISGSYPLGNSSITPSFPGTQIVNIGSHSNGSNLANYKQDATTIWQKELTQSEITELYNSGNGAQYIGDNFYKPTTNDALNTNNGTAQGGLTYGLGKVGTAFQFNGTNAYVSLPDNSLNLTGPYSISMWVYFASNPSGETPYLLNSVNATSNTGFEYRIRLGKPEINLYTSGGLFTSWYASNEVFNTSGWYHLILVKPLNQQPQFYVNGVSTLTGIRVSNATVTEVTYTNPVKCSIGNNVIFSSNYMPNGSRIDALNIWTKELTQAEVTELYNSGNGKQYPN